jgi:hypothetical protein
MKRPDVAERIKARKLLQETVVKCSLKKLLLGNEKKKIVKAIENRVQSCSHRYHRASIALNLLVRQLFDGQENVNDVQVPEFWDTTFVRQLMLGTEDAHAKNPFITTLFKENPALLSTKDRYFGDRNIYSFAATKLATNIKNHLRLNLERMVKKYFYDLSGLDKDKATECVKFLCKWTIQSITDKKSLDQLSIVQAILGTPSISLSFLKSDSNLINIIKFFVFVNRAMEKANVPLYNILPICKIKSHFITMDTSVFKGILQEVNIIKNAKDDILDLELWESVFDISKVKGKAKTFTRTIDTDGCVINVHFTKPKVLKKEDNIDGSSTSLVGKRVIGVDPGRSNIYTMTEEVAMGTYKKYTLTRKQYYTESGINKANKNSSRWNKGIKKELSLLSKNSPKSASLSLFNKYLEALLSVEKTLWKELTKGRWREQRFRLYGGKKRVFARFFNKLGDPTNTVLAYGSAKFAPGGKNEVAVPVGRSYKEATYRFKTVLIDEFRTSKVNWKTLATLETVVTRSKDKKLKTIRGLLWCCSTIESEGKFVDRDLNAAINILRCATLPRPRILERRHARNKLPDRIGKII